MLMAQYRGETSKQIGGAMRLGYEACIISLHKRLYERLFNFNSNFYYYSCLTSMCNPVGYDRLKCLYIQESSLVGTL